MLERFANVIAADVARSNRVEQAFRSFLFATSPAEAYEILNRHPELAEPQIVRRIEDLMRAAQATGRSSAIVALRQRYGLLQQFRSAHGARRAQPPRRPVRAVWPPWTVVTSSVLLVLIATSQIVYLVASLVTGDQQGASVDRSAAEDFAVAAVIVAVPLAISAGWIVLAISMLKRKKWARLGTWIVGVPYLACCGMYGFIHLTDVTLRQRGYILLAATIEIIDAAAIVVAMMLLAAPRSNRYFAA